MSGKLDNLECLGAELAPILLAINEACRLHDGQKRKGDPGLPYVSHPFGVFTILLLAGIRDTNTLIAALFHDSLEDVIGARERLLKICNSETMSIIEEVTEKKDPSVESDAKATWRDRKEEQLWRMWDASYKALLVYAGDKTQNLRSAIMDYAEKGEEYWKVFNAKPEQIWWYYESAAEILRDRLQGEPILALFEETYAEAKEKVFEVHRNVALKSV